MIVCIVGPTASGKTTLAIELAQKFNGEIVNADSRQIYRELNIGTAKPSKEEQQEVPHHLVDCASIVEPWSAGWYAREAGVVIAEIQKRKKLPVIVGGTGLYIKALLFGLDEVEAISDPVRSQLRQELETKGIASLYAELQRVDPVSADRLKPRDTQRILRALEVFRQTGRGINEFWKAETKQPRYSYAKLAVNVERKELYRRIDERVVEMFKEGLKEEAEHLIRKYPDNAVLKKTIGYAEWMEMGFDDERKVMAAIQKNTRNFAKRQLTWFRREKDVEWVTAPFQFSQLNHLDQ